MIGQVRGVDFQQRPNTQCRNIMALMDGCNHLICNVCFANLCFSCGLEIDPEGDHWRLGSRCPRYNQPGAANAQFDDEGEIDEEDNEILGHQPPPNTPRIQTIQNFDHVAGQLRLIALFRLEDGGAVDREWVSAVFSNMIESRDLNDFDREMNAFGLYARVDDLRLSAPRLASTIVPILSEEGLDHVAVRIAQSMSMQGPRPFDFAWFQELVRDFEAREMQLDEYEDLHSALEPMLIMIMQSYIDGLFEVTDNDVTAEINAWADNIGLDPADEPVKRLLRAYDDIYINYTVAELILEGERTLDAESEEGKGFLERHAAIEQTVQQMPVELKPGVLDTSYQSYIEIFPAWLLY